MGWKKNLIEAAVWLTSRVECGTSSMPALPKSIFVLRNNDLGDLLTATPLFQALRNRFPNTKIVAGIGHWNLGVLKNNPYVDDILIVNAPWKNKFVSSQSLWNALSYIKNSPESRELARRRFDVGIDVFGTPLGSLLMMCAGIPYRLGVRGYAGGHTGVQQYVEFDETVHAGRAALKFAELLGGTELPVCRPQIYLTDEERSSGIHRWSEAHGTDKKQRIVIGPGGGFPEKCWPLPNFVQLVRMLEALDNIEIVVVGGEQDRAAGQEISAGSDITRNLAGALLLRETFGLVAAADLVISNSSMLMHAAAAFYINTVVLLGDCFDSASLHHKQWGYPDTCVVLGKDRDVPEIATPQDAFKFSCGYLARSSQCSTGELVAS